MGILTIPKGTRLHRRQTQGQTFEYAFKEFDVLAMPTRDPFGEDAYSFKMRDEYWYVLKADVEDES